MQKTPSVDNSPSKRLWLTVGLIAVTAAFFWLGSRYPALNEKALMGGEAELSALGFTPLLTVPVDAGMLGRIAFNSINWIYTNGAGMTFGIVMACLMLTLLPLLGQRRFRSRLANTLVGVLIGSPLGVCVNCATPIAQGMYMAGGRLETTLATLFSSPTLNIIVLTMTFSLFPPYMAGLKVGLTVGFILIAVPLLARLIPDARLPTEEQLRAVSEQRSGLTRIPIVSWSAELDSESWGAAALWLLRTAVRNLWMVARLTLPLMLLAGVLGATVITLWPFDSLDQILPQGGRTLILVAMGLVALIGVFLPVPMAFDVVVVAVLMEAGLAVKYAMVLLFTLGIFSIYPMLMLWQTVSRRLALILFAMTATTGLFAGVAGNEIDQWEQVRWLREAQSALSAEARGPLLRAEAHGPLHPTAADDLIATGQIETWDLEPVDADTESGIMIRRTPFRAPAASRSSDTLFHRYLGHELGIEEHDNFSILKLQDPWALFRGIASGDVNLDGWPDVVVSSDQGLTLYANLHGERFAPLTVDVAQAANTFVANVALVDIDNDGWLDLFFATYGQGSFIIINDNGHFAQKNLVELPNFSETVLVSAPAFGDVDQDGDLDIVLGNWSAGRGGWDGHEPGAQNGWLRQQNMDFELLALPGVPGQTLSTQLSDLDDDGDLDLLVGNDYLPPDYFYINDGQGGFEPIRAEQQIIPETTTATMSMHVADINNDLLPDIYIGQISGEPMESAQRPEETCAELVDTRYYRQCQQAAAFRNHMHRIDGQDQPRNCLNTLSSLSMSSYREDCLAIKLYRLGWLRKQRAYCLQLPAAWQPLRTKCLASLTVGDAPMPEIQATFIEQNRRQNILLVKQPAGDFKNLAVERNLHDMGWTWNAKFADVDNDEWQDLYLVNGMFYDATLYKTSNRFLQNVDGKTFQEATSVTGLQSLLDTLAYTYVDYDVDGDIDIITVPSVGPLSIYQNQSTRSGRQAIAFRIEDEIGNSHGIGSRIVLRYGPKGERRQLREIQASGGFISFDPPMAYFGLGKYEHVTNVEIIWSTGEHTSIESDLAAGYLYTITRSAQ